jgi:large repetitive protein
MNLAGILQQPLLGMAEAIGLASSTDELNTGWFANPLQRIESILTDSGQRAALFNLLDQVLPPLPVAGASTGAKWHPLLGTQPEGNLFLTIDESATPIVIGLGAQFGTGTASLLAEVPVLGLNGGSLSAITGTASGNVRLLLNVALNLHPPENAIALASISVALVFAPAASPPVAEVVVVLEGLDLDGSGAKDVKVDPSALGVDAATLIVGLIREKLAELVSSGTAAGDALAVATHLIPLLGLDGSLPAFPFATLASNPQALTTWLQALTAGDPPPLAQWLVHLAGLLGAAAPAATAGTSGKDSIWTVPLFAPNATSSVNIGLVLGVAADAVTRTLGVRIGASLAPAAGTAALTTAVTLFEAPLSGPSAARVLPDASVIVRAPAGPGALIAPAAGSFSIDSIQAGILWNGSTIAPLLELDNVVIPSGGSFPKIDLSNANTIVSSAASGLIQAVLAGLGASGAGAHLAALAGLVEPAADPAAPLADVTQLVTNPGRAIATLHRNALLSVAQPWSIYLSELAALISLPTAVTGSGSLADPWTATIATLGPLRLTLVAFNAQTSGNAADPQQLRLGIRLEAGGAAAALSWTSALIAADLPATGANHVSLFAEHDVAVTLQPPPWNAGATQIAATSVSATFSLVAGASANVRAAVNGLTVTAPGGSVSVPTLAFPFPAGFDPQNPTAALGISSAQLEKIATALLSLAMTDALGSAGTAMAVLLGCGAGAPGLPADLPSVGDVASGTLFTDPAGSLRTWLDQIATTVSASGVDDATPVAAWLAALLAGNLPDPGFSTPPASLSGSGTYDDPWVMPLADSASSAQGLLWLEPNGPPSSAALASAAVSAATDFPSLVSAVAAATRYLGAWPDGVDATSLATGLQSLATYLSSSDGVVPVASQQPSGGSWASGTALVSAHPAQPANPSAISQILAQADAWAAPGTPRAILLLGPAFSNHTIWELLLEQAEAAHAGSTNAGAFFHLRVPGVVPASIDLRPVTAVADYYTVDLADDSTNDVAGLVSQIGLIVARLNDLRPGATLVLVAHSTAGVIARAYAAANAAAVKGLITVGSPHQGAPLTPLLDEPTADALRVIGNWLPNGVAAGPLQDALAHLARALDGYLPPPAAPPGALPIAWPYPVADFAGAGTTTTGGVPALALGGQLGGVGGVNLLSALQTALAAQITAFAATPATYLSFGVRLDLNLGNGATGSASTVVASADASVRVDIGRLALTAGAVAPPRPAQAFTAQVALTTADGWLVGDPRSYAGTAPAVDVRVRSARLGLTLALGGGPVQATPFAALRDVAFHGTTAPLVGWTDPVFAAALGAIFTANGIGPGVAPGTPLGNLMALLQAIGIATVPANATTPIGIAADAVNALSTDPIGFLAPRLQSAFTNGAVHGFSAAVTGGFTCPIGSLPLEAFASLSPPSFGLRTTVGGPGVTLGGSVTATGSVAISLTTMQAVISAGLQAGPATLTYTGGTLSLQIAGTSTSLSLVPPPSAAQAEAAFAAWLPPLLVSSVGSSLLNSLAGPGYKVTGLWSFLSAPWDWLIGANALGDGTVFDPAKLTALIGLIPGLPAGLTLTAAGKNPTTITLATGAPIGDVLAISAGITLDSTGHATPAATLGINAPTTGTWPQIALAFGVSATGLSLVLTPGGASPIQILPTFDGAAALAGAAKKLLPEALDALLDAVAPAAKPPLVSLALDVATALDLYDAAGGFSAHAAQLAAMTGSGWLAALSAATRADFITAASAYFNDPASPLNGALPGTIAATGSALTWTYPLTAGTGSGSIAVTVGWDGSGPTITLGTANLALESSPVAASLTAGYAGGTAALSGGLGLSLQSSLGLTVKPQLAFTLGGGSPSSFSLLPLGAGTASTMDLQLAPAVSLTFASGAPVTFVEDWVLPLAADLLIAATGADFTQPIYNGGPTCETLLSQANLITIPAPHSYLLKTPLPAVGAVLSALLQALPSVPVTLASNPTLNLLLGNLGGQLGVALQGSIAVSAGTPAISLLFGQPDDQPTVPGAQLSLFTIGATPTFAPSLSVRGIGVGVAGDGNNPLFSGSGIRIGGIEGFIAFTFDLQQLQFGGQGGGLEVTDLGLPFGLLDGASSSNPVASGLLGSDAGSGSGDSSPVNPGLDVEVTYLNGALGIKLAGTTEPIVIPVHASFGPIYIDQFDVALNGTDSVSLGIDGSVSINGLNVSLIELSVLIPIRNIAQPSDWSLDLQGLAVGFDSGPVEISGGLRKNPGPPIEYDGMLSVMIEGLGLTVVGSYARPSDAQGSYTSLFIFVALGIPLGGPPFAFVTGLGGGFGYDRELIVPTDLNDLDSFVLVAAIDDDSLANDPLDALMQMSQQIPPRRGAFWIAAGVRLTTCGLINSVVVVSIALDRGLDIEVIGVSRMALPTEDAALVSVELALRACFNSAEQILSVQAQLTDNSYLFSRDCQLTGGFALVLWYGQGQFVVTLGGYNPVFTPPPQFPAVQRLGFNWSVGSIVTIKGGAYFALTNSCVMAGGSLSATASIGPVKAWYDAYIDFLVAWDPFAYQFDIGVEIGASVSIRVCFFGCVTIGITISVGAQLSIAGPPFHGTASIDAYVTTITNSFGDPPQPQPHITDWSVFAGKYLTGGDPSGSAVSMQVNAGLLVTDPPGAQPRPGTPSQPWQLGVEFTLATTTRMPASSTPATIFGGVPVNVPGNLNSLDIAPMDLQGIASTHTLALEQNVNGNWSAVAPDNAPAHFTINATQGYFPEAIWRYTDPAHIPAAARVIAAISGFTIDSHVVLNNESAPIPISTLVADLAMYAKPLPFATTAAVVGVFKTYGDDAATLAAAIAGATSIQTVTAGAAILSGKNVFSQNRTALGLPAPGLPPLAVQALKTSRSAPPLLTPLTTGLTMKPVGLPKPIPVTVLTPVTSILLTQPRLRAALQSVAAPVTDAAPSLHTSVTGLLPSLLKASPRTAPPGFITPPAVVGARLIIVPSAAAPSPTRAAVPARAIRNADLGAATGPAHQQALIQAAQALLAGGVTLGAGATHLWDLPDDRGRFTIAGNAAVRILCTDRSGNALSDIEYVAGGTASQTMPKGTAMVAITCLGVLPDGAAAPAAGFGAITGRFAPTGKTAAVGWQSTGTLTQIGPSRFMARGATLRIIQSHRSARNGQTSSYGTPAAGDVVAGQKGVETRLPADVSVVMIGLDILDPAAAADGDLALAIVGGTVAETPVRVITGGRRLLLYDVATRDPQAVALVISVASASAHKVGAVIGLNGRSAEWANLFASGVPDHFVPDEALSPGGSITVNYS